MRQAQARLAGGRAIRSGHGCHSSAAGMRGGARHRHRLDLRRPARRARPRLWRTCRADGGKRHLEHPPAARARSASGRRRARAGGRAHPGGTRQPSGQPKRHRRERGFGFLRAAGGVRLPQRLWVRSRGGLPRRVVRGGAYLCRGGPWGLVAPHRRARRHGVHGDLHRRHEHDHSS